MTAQSPLSHAYVFGYIFQKLADTFEKYRDLLSPLEELELAIVSQEKPEDVFEVTMIVLEKLQEHAKKSPLVLEIFENTRMDFYHGIDPGSFPKHEGKYYIDSVAD